MSIKPIKLGIVGCGYWGPNLVRNFSQINGCRVKYVCDLNHQKLAHMKELHPDVITTHNAGDMFNDPELDAVIISTPAETHYQLAKESLLKGKHTLVEKPIAKQIKHARELIGLARRYNRILMVGHTFKFNPGIKKLRSLIQHNELGKLYYIYSRRTNLGPLRKDVNSLWDLAPHDISIISYLLNAQPVDVIARGKRFLEHNLEDVVFMTLTYPRNIFSHVHVSWLDPRKVREITVVGSKKMVVFDDLNIEHPLKIYDKSVVKKHFKHTYDTFEEFQMIIREGKTSTPRIRFQEPLKIECRHFIECIKYGNKPLTDGNDGLRVLAVMNALQQSLQLDGKRVQLKENYRTARR